MQLLGCVALLRFLSVEYLLYTNRIKISGLENKK